MLGQQPWHCYASIYSYAGVNMASTRHTGCLSSAKQPCFIESALVLPGMVSKAETCLQHIVLLVHVLLCGGGCRLLGWGRGGGAGRPLSPRLPLRGPLRCPLQVSHGPWNCGTCTCTQSAISLLQPASWGSCCPLRTSRGPRNNGSRVRTQSAMRLLHAVSCVPAAPELIQLCLCCTTSAVLQPCPGQARSLEELPGMRVSMWDVVGMR